MSATKVIKLLHAKEVPLFTLNELGNMLRVANRQSLYKRIQRLEKDKVLERLTKGKYRFLLKDMGEFTIANFLRAPSYISMESALSFYSIMTAFPYQITSITIRKSKEIHAGGKEYSYSQISADLFWGWEKKRDFLIALPEKALFDYLYFSGKGLRRLDWGEIDTSDLKMDLLASWAKKFKINI